MKTEQIAISKIKLNPSNPRVIKDDKFQKLVQSIRDFPEMLEIRPIVVNSDMIILGGNMRLRACQQAGLKTVPVLKVNQLSAEKQREFIIKDNVGFGEWDYEMLSNDWDLDQLENWGLDIPEFAIDLQAEEDDFEVPEGGIETDIVLGDLFEIGEHRLLCGDSTISSDVDKLLQGKEPYLMVADPPYGVNYDADWRNHTGMARADRAIGKVSNDDRSDWKDSYSLAPCKVAYVWHAGLHTKTVQQNLEDCDFVLRAQIIWNKNHFPIGRGDYHVKHEPCLYAVKKGSKGNWASDRKQTTVWDIDKPQKSETGHSTQKPVECMARPIKNHDGDVYDPFLGSGTTMVAAHQLKRKCYGMELDPKYCQAVVDRMLKLDPEIKIIKNGKEYAIQTPIAEVAG